MSSPYGSQGSPNTIRRHTELLIETDQAETVLSVMLVPRLCSNHLAGALRINVQAAAENTNTFATITGEAPMSTPYITHSSAPHI